MKLENEKLRSKEAEEKWRVVAADKEKLQEKFTDTYLALHKI